MDNLSDLMRERLQKWRKISQEEPRAKIFKPLRDYERQEFEMQKFEEENNARHNKGKHETSSKTK